MSTKKYMIRKFSESKIYPWFEILAVNIEEAIKSFLIKNYLEFNSPINYEIEIRPYYNFSSNVSELYLGTFEINFEIGQIKSI
jgi:hypothetical protein